MFSKCQRLFRSPSMPCSVIRPILKRLERPHDRDVPVLSKRRKSGTPLEEQQLEEPVSSALWGAGLLTWGCVWAADALGVLSWAKVQQWVVCSWLFRWQGKEVSTKQH